MRTTLTIDADVLETAKELAAASGRSVGSVVSELARRGLQPAPPDEADTRNGFALLPARGGLVTSALVRDIMDEEAL